MTRRWVFGLQGWLVGALLAVGMAASLAVLLVVLPTLESSVRGDRAKRDGEELARDVRAAGRDSGLSNTVTQEQLRELVTQLRGEAGLRQARGVRVGLWQNAGGLTGFDETACAVGLLQR